MEKLKLTTEKRAELTVKLLKCQIDNAIENRDRPIEQTFLEGVLRVHPACDSLLIQSLVRYNPEKKAEAQEFKKNDQSLQEAMRKHALAACEIIFADELGQIRSADDVDRVINEAFRRNTISRLIALHVNGAMCVAAVEAGGIPGRLVPILGDVAAAAIIAALCHDIVKDGVVFAITLASLQACSRLKKKQLQRFVPPAREGRDPGRLIEGRRERDNNGAGEAEADRPNAPDPELPGEPVPDPGMTVP